jgi:hypothetical protein
MAEGGDAMADDVIVEVENDPQEGVVVTVNEGAEGVDIPAPCAGCLGEATKRLSPTGVSWLEFPYCDACVRPLSDAATRKMKSRALIILVVLTLMFFVSLWFAILGLLVFADVGGQRGKAVKMLHSEGGTVRLAFKNKEYARLFVEANGAGSSWQAL